MFQAESGHPDVVIFYDYNKFTLEHSIFRGHLNMGNLDASQGI
jgi:hypothetical protein